jgi:hypothetical protein
MPVETTATSWFLHTPNSTYVMKAGPFGHLEHAHWGGRLKKSDPSSWRPRHGGSFSPHPSNATSDDYSSDTAGLDPRPMYRDKTTGALYGGDWLMGHGFVFDAQGDFVSRMWELKRVRKQ